MIWLLLLYFCLQCLLAFLVVVLGILVSIDVIGGVRQGLFDLMLGLLRVSVVGL